MNIEKIEQPEASSISANGEASALVIDGVLSRPPKSFRSLMPLQLIVVPNNISTAQVIDREQAQLQKSVQHVDGSPNVSIEKGSTNRSAEVIDGVLSRPPKSFRSLLPPQLVDVSSNISTAQVIDREQAQQQKSVHSLESVQHFDGSPNGSFNRSVQVIDGVLSRPPKSFRSLLPPQLVDVSSNISTAQVIDREQAQQQKSVHSLESVQHVDGSPNGSSNRSVQVIDGVLSRPPNHGQKCLNENHATVSAVQEVIGGEQSSTDSTSSAAAEFMSDNANHFVRFDTNLLQSTTSSTSSTSLQHCNMSPSESAEATTSSHSSINRVPIIIEEIQVSDEEFHRRMEADSAAPSAAVRMHNQRELYDLLKKWDLPILFNALVDRNIDINSLKDLSDEECSILTRSNENLMGPLARLRVKIKSLVVDGGDFDLPTIDSNNVIDIKLILLTDIRGKSINKFYHQNKQLDKEQRNLLIDVVLDHIINKNEPSTIPTREIENLVDEICSIFPSESKAEYFIPKGDNFGNSGRMYDAYNKKIRKLRRQGILPPSATAKNKKRKIEIEEELEAEEHDDILQENIQLLKSYDHTTMDVSIEEIIELWNEMYEYRTRKLDREKRPDIINDWSILRHPEAYRLIEIEFQKKFGDTLKDRARLPQAWETLFAKSEIVFADLRNSYCRRILGTIEENFNADETQNEKNVIWALAIHGLFQPTIRGSGNGEVTKSSIRDSQDSFLQLTTEDDFHGVVTERDSNRRLKRFMQHPYIVGICILKEDVTKSSKMKRYNDYIYDILEIQRIQTFRVIFESTIFENENFLTALDFCYRVYSSLKIPYPECKKVWCFLDQAFYGLSNETTSKIVEILKKLK